MIARRDSSHDTQRKRDTADSCNNLARGDVGRERLLIFTKGSRTYTPHQIGIKRMPCSVSELLAKQRADDIDVETLDFGHDGDNTDDDDVDVSIELHGHIIGMNLSPDHRSACPSASLLLLICCLSVRGSYSAWNILERNCVFEIQHPWKCSKTA